MADVQTVNPVETPLLLLLFVFLAGAFIRLAYLGICRRPVIRTAMATGATLLVYFAALLIVGVASQQVNLPRGTAKCFDDWCASPVAASRIGKYLVIELRVSSIARGTAQRPDEPRVSLISDDGNTYDASPDGLDAVDRRFGSQRPLDSRIEPGDAFTTKLAYELPTAASSVKVVIDEGPPWLTAVIIGDENGLLHKKAVYRLDLGGR
jgi:hypothetical protein